MQHQNRHPRAQCYLNVPYADNGKVKVLGGRWDHRAKQWFVPFGVDVSQFTQWFWPDLMDAKQARHIQAILKGEA